MDSLSHKTRIITRQELIDQGFDSEQLASLSALRERYPFIEFLDSRQEWNRLAFLKWLMQQEDETQAKTENRSLANVPNQSIERKS